jgi:hypothetical protein
MYRIKTVGVTLVLLLLLAACALPGPEPTPQPTGVDEYEVTTIPLADPLSKNQAEISGLAWYGDRLIILPQYPTFNNRKGDGEVYTLPKADILAYLDGTRSAPLVPTPIPFVAPGLARQIDGFEGYEAIAFSGDRAFLTIEAAPGKSMKGYLVSGYISSDLSALVLDTTVLPQIQPQSTSDNKSDETLLVVDDTLVTIYEVNGTGVNTSPVAHLFDTALTPAGTIPFPHVEYRITDATSLDDKSRFWAINYFFPGDSDLLPEMDPLTDRFGEGATHAMYEPVERLVEFQYDETGIHLTDTPPIQLELLPDDARNWEGLVRLDDRGFLLMTDKFPDTILGFVAFPNQGP